MNLSDTGIVLGLDNPDIPPGMCPICYELDKKGITDPTERSNAHPKVYTDEN
jgi:hypothetical protein